MKHWIVQSAQGGNPTPNQTRQNRTAEEVLSGSEAKFSKAFHGAVAANTLTKLKDGTFIDVNDQWLKINGFRREEVIGRTVRELNVWLDPKQIKDFVWELEENDVLHDKEYEFRRKNGEAWTGRLSSQIIELGGEKVVLSSHIDISEQKKAEDALRWTKQRDELLAGVASQLLSIDETQSIIEDLAVRTMKFLNCDVFFNFLVDQNNGGLLLNAYAGIPDEEAEKMKHLDFDNSMCGRAAFEGKRVVAEDLQRFMERSASFVKSQGLQAYECHPLLAEGKVIGTLSFGSRSRTRFTANELSVIQDVSAYIAIAIHRLMENRALAEKEEKYRHLIKYAPTGIYEVDFVNSRFKSVNDAMCQILGYSEAELLAMSPFDILEEESKRKFAGRIRKVAAGEEVDADVEYKVKAKDGRELWASLNASFIYEHGKVIKALVVAHDITERTKLDEALKESEAKYRSFVEQLADGVSLTDEDGLLIEWNKGLEEITKLRREEVIGQYFWDVQRELMLEERKKEVSIEAMKKPMSEALRTGQAPFLNRTLEVNFLRADGEVRRNSQTIFPIKTERGYRIGSIVRDITEKRRAEEALKESEAKFRQIFNSTNDAMFVSDLQGRFLEVNETACQQMGYTREELIELGAASITPPEIAAHIPDKITETKEKGHLVFETVHLTKYGNQIPVELSIQMISYQGNPAILGVARDITERKKADDELKRSNAELQQFAYVASHDLREPLRMISSYLELLVKRYDGKVLDDKAEEFIDFAVDGAYRMQQLINDILAYSRVETRGEPFSLVDMNEALAIALKDLRKGIEESGASITHGDLPSVMADKLQIVLLLENLIGNAIKFHGLEAPQIHVSCQRGWNEAVFSVKDNGIGIAKGQQERIFEMFQRLHSKEEYEGTGIGLSIANKIVERHGGRIWVESEEGKGATFFFTMPKGRN